MKPGYALAMVLGGGGALFGLIFEPQERIIWNRTASAPEGLYWLGDDPFTYGRWVALSARSAPAEWAERQGFVGKGWPLLKQVAGLPGDEICRVGQEVSINGKPAAMAQPADYLGRELPAWDGCRRLREGQLFLLNPHPSSLDGRYFGPVAKGDILGVAVPVLVQRRPDPFAD